MRCKSLISTVAFITAFSFSAALAGLFPGSTVHEKNSCFHTNSRTASVISEFIRRDVRNGEKRENNVSRSFEATGDPFSSDTIAEYASAVNNYAADSGSMNDSQLPGDVREAWRVHMEAWADYADFLNRMDEQAYRLNDTEVARARTGHIRRINVTWYELLRISEDHGADVDF